MLALSLREFLRLGSRERVPDHSWLSKTRARLPHEVHAAVFDWVLALIGEAGLVKGERIGVDASTIRALRNIVRRDTGEGYREIGAPGPGERHRDAPADYLSTYEDWVSDRPRSPSPSTRWIWTRRGGGRRAAADEGDTTTLPRSVGERRRSEDWPNV